jgi:hypothetical protein
LEGGKCASSVECGVWRTVVLSRVDADGAERTTLDLVL